jgi:hypothetical protein
MDLKRERKALSHRVLGLAVLFLAARQVAQSAELGPPLACELCPTSSFGSRRMTHIHAGIDFSTGGRIGVPVLAVDTCRVWRVSVQNGGYGRALYVMLPSKEVVVYGHTYKYAPSIERAVEAEQDRLGVYEVEIYPEPSTFCFLPGDTIAYSGDTGAGPPHLHFEIRSGQYDHSDINPFPRRLDLRDQVPPKIRKVRLEPLGPESTVNGAFEPVTLVPGAVAGPVRIAGPFGASVYATDVGVCGRSMWPTCYEAWVDEEQIWKLEFQQFPFSKSHFARVFYHPVGGTPYFRLFDPYGLDLEGFSCLAPGCQTVFGRLSKGPHSLRIRVSDVWGNHDDTTVPFVYGAVPEFRAFALDADGPDLGVKVATDEACAATVSYRRSGGAWHLLEVEDDGGEMVGRIEGPTSGLEVACKLTDASGTTAEGLLAAGPGPEASRTARIETTIHPDFLEILGYTGHAPSALPLAEIKEGGDAGTCLLQPLRAGVYKGCYYLKGGSQSVVVTASFRFGSVTVQETRELTLGCISTGSEVSFDGANLKVRLVADRKRSPRTFLAMSEQSGSCPAGFASCGGRLVFEPREAFFENGLEIQLASASPKLTAKYGLFSEAGGGLSFLAAFDSDGSCRASLFTLDPLVVLEDTAPPGVRLSGVPVRRRDGTVTFTGSAFDGASGVDSRTIRAFVDDKPAIASYDPDTGKISVRTIGALPGGSHRFRLEAEDKLGNTGLGEGIRQLAK